MLEHLKDVFSIVPSLILSATITPDILDYIRVSLKLLPPSWMYRLPFDWPNLRYMVYTIRKLDFWDLAFLIPKHDPISEIPKTIIFIDKIKDTIEMEKYRRSRLPDHVRNGNQAFVII